MREMLVMLNVLLSIEISADTSGFKENRFTRNYDVRYYYYDSHLGNH